MVSEVLFLIIITIIIIFLFIFFILCTLLSIATKIRAVIQNTLG